MQREFYVFAAESATINTFFGRKPLFSPKIKGAVTDGIGNALYGEMSFKDGAAEKANFDKYRMIRMSEAPKAIDVHFVKNEIAPTGMGEPPFPPIFGALANALYKATGKRVYRQPFLGDRAMLG